MCRYCYDDVVRILTHIGGGRKWSNFRARYRGNPLRDILGYASKEHKRALLFALAIPLSFLLCVWTLFLFSAGYNRTSPTRGRRIARQIGRGRPQSIANIAIMRGEYRARRENHAFG